MLSQLKSSGNNACTYPILEIPKDEFERERQETVERPRAIGRPQTGNEHTDDYARELDRLRSQANADGNTTEYSWEYEFLLVQVEGNGQL